MEHDEASLRLWQSLGNPVRMARWLNNLGWELAQLGEYDHGRTYCEAALCLCVGVHRPAEAHTLNSLGWIARRTGDESAALDYDTRALRLFRVLGKSEDLATTLQMTGSDFWRLGRVADARSAWRESAETYLRACRPADADRLRQLIDDSTTDCG